MNACVLLIIKLTNIEFYFVFPYFIILYYQIIIHENKIKPNFFIVNIILNIFKFDALSSWC